MDMLNFNNASETEGQQNKQKEKGNKTNKDNAIFVEIMKAYRSGDETKQKWAKNRMCEELYGLIGLLIDKHYPTFKEKYYSELFSEGVIGILSEMDKYDPSVSKASTFFTYAIIHNLSSFVNKLINKSSNHHSANMNKIRKALDFFKKENIEPTLADISLFTSLTVRVVKEELERIKNVDHVYYGNIQEIESYMMEFQSPEDKCLEKEKMETIHSALLSLDDLSREIIFLHFGFYNEEPVSYNIIARRLNLTPQKVRLIHQKALKDLLKDKNLKHLPEAIAFKERQRKYLGTLQISSDYSKVEDLYKDLSLAMSKEEEHIEGQIQITETKVHITF